MISVLEVMKRLMEFNKSTFYFFFYSILFFEALLRSTTQYDRNNLPPNNKNAPEHIVSHMDVHVYR